MEDWGKVWEEMKEEDKLWPNYNYEFQPIRYVIPWEKPWSSPK